MRRRRALRRLAASARTSWEALERARFSATSRASGRHFGNGTSSALVPAGSAERAMFIIMALKV
jgi:hypothetical protein